MAPSKRSAPGMRVSAGRLSWPTADTRTSASTISPSSVSIRQRPALSSKSAVATSVLRRRSVLQPVLANAPLEVVEDLPLAASSGGSTRGSARTRTSRGGRDVAGGPGVGVVAPHPSHPVGLLEDRQVADRPRLLQRDREADPAEAGADDRDAGRAMAVARRRGRAVRQGPAAPDVVQGASQIGHRLVCLAQQPRGELEVVPHALEARVADIHSRRPGALGKPVRVAHQDVVGADLEVGRRQPGEVREHGRELGVARREWRRRRARRPARSGRGAGRGRGGHWPRPMCRSWSGRASRSGSPARPAADRPNPAAVPPGRGPGRRRPSRRRPRWIPAQALDR